jgi:spore coat polysaccharide biosynthesis predicted glycosyltransferase SpsG
MAKQAHRLRSPRLRSANAGQAGQSARCVVRVAAGPRVGYGHLMRARALAQHLAMQVSLSVRGGRAATQAARSLGLRVGGSPPSLTGADLLVVDDPSLKEGRPWIARARRAGVPSVSVHDGVNAHDADLVICGSIGVGEIRAAGTVLNGPEFYLLDRRIRLALRKRWTSTNPRPLRVLVALGGGQHVRGVAQELVLAIRRHAGDVAISVAAGFSRGRRPELDGARWVSARKGLTKALVDCDVAVVAGGVTLYEACALGTPSVALAVVAAQRRAILQFAARGAVIDAGLVSEVSVERAARNVARLLGDEQRRRATAGRARQLVDGLGAQRAAEQIRAMLARGARRSA